MTITLTKGEETKIFTSWNEAKRDITGNPTGANSKNCQRAVENAGWKVVKVEGASTRTKSSINIIERVVKQASTIDKEAIKQLKAERDALVPNMKSSKDADKVMKLNNKIQELHNPSIDREAIVEWFTKQLDEYLKQGEEA